MIVQIKAVNMQKIKTKSKEPEDLFEDLKNKAYFLDEAEKIAKFGYYVLDINSGKWEQSPGLDEIFGTNFPEGRTLEVWLRIIHPDDREKMKSYFRDEVLTELQPFDKKYRILKPDHSVIWVHGKGKLSFNKDGQPVKMFGTIQDISEQKRIEEEIQDIKHLYENLVETSQELIFQTDNEGRFIFVNKACFDILGFSHHEMIGRRYVEFLHSGKIEEGGVFFLESLPEDQLRGRESVWVSKNNTPVYLRLNIRKTYNKEGQYNGAIGTAYDITDAINSEKLARLKSEELNNYFTLSLDLLAVANLEGYFTMLNPSWQRVLGFSLEELKSKKILDLIHPDDIEATAQAIQELQTGKEIQCFINRYRCKDQSYRYIEWRSKAKNRKIYAAARDVTDHILLEKSLRKANDNLKELNYQKDKFLYIIAHDLRNPLNNILGFMELLYTNFNNNNAIENYELVRLLSGNVHSLYELVENLLNWALSQTGKLKASLTNIDLSVQVRRAINHLKSLADAKQIIIDNLIPDGITVVADEHMLNTVVRNLVSNSIKFSHPGGYVKVAHKQQGDRVLVEIHDSGIGIEASVVSRLFNAETTRSTPGTQGEGGTGFGLPLCNELIKAQNGEISATSQVGKGSIFSFSLPKR
ncbi:hypothetical protein CDL62_08215 [Alkalitalea saponilacus]|uniref:histidine kinase n=2 Tax=Alkalitalea saponilacus TaxID=889453 RepID=A0A1T5E231_9BACT|nr:hypothetical protein CDL62_08215 [Alkalitalea saponilacus]SKB77991.1 PAS domain S-box-containing protein [Alkalitalea saponilacus]